jgi:hypothetical protein
MRAEDQRDGSGGPKTYQKNHENRPTGVAQLPNIVSFID